MRFVRRNVMPKKRSVVCAGLVGLWVGVSVACPATAQGPDVNAISKLIARGDHAAALTEAKKLEAAAKAQFGTNHNSYANALNTLATVYVAQQKYDEAEGLYRRALAIREKVLGKDHLDVAHTLTNLSLVYSLQRKFGEAEGVLRRALAIQEKAPGENDVTVAMTLGLLASACLGQGKTQEADALHERGRSILDNAMGRKRP
jgi:tetratricopeptide (TPR) repeat protein